MKTWLHVIASFVALLEPKTSHPRQHSTTPGSQPKVVICIYLRHCSRRGFRQEESSSQSCVAEALKLMGRKRTLTTRYPTVLLDACMQGLLRRTRQKGSVEGSIPEARGSAIARRPRKCRHLGKRLLGGPQDLPGLELYHFYHNHHFCGLLL